MANVSSESRRFKYEVIEGKDWALIVLFFLQLGMQTNKVYDKPISFILTIAITLGLLFKHKFRLYISRVIGKSIIWYTILVMFCTFSFLWATDINRIYINSLISDVYIPLILTLICINIYIMEVEYPSLRILKCLVIAEALTAIRALINSPIIKIITTFDTRLYANGLGVNYNHYTTQFALIFIICMFISENFDKKYRWISLFLVFNIFISGSRKAIIVSAIGSALIIIFKGNFRNVLTKLKRVCFIVIIAMCILVVIVRVPFLYNMLGKNLILAVKSIGQSAEEIALNEVIDHSAHGRAVLRENAFEQFLLHPFIGLGYYCFQFHNTYGLYAHNNYLELLADLGIIGFILYYYYYASCFVYAIKNRNKHKINKFTVLFLTFLACQIIIEYSHITFFRTYALIPLFVVTISMFYESRGREGIVQLK